MPIQSRPTALVLLAGCLFLSGAGLSAQQGVEAYSFLVGSWEGELDYLDYGDSETHVRLPTRLTCEASPDGSSLELRFSYQEPSGRVETSTERLIPSPDGLYLGDLWQVKAPVEEVSPGVFRVVLQREGEDNGLAALIVNSLALEGEELTITSTVTYEATGESLQRHQYRLRRSRD